MTAPTRAGGMQDDRDDGARRDTRRRPMTEYRWMIRSAGAGGETRDMEEPDSRVEADTEEDARIHYECLIEDGLIDPDGEMEEVR